MRKAFIHSLCEQARKDSSLWLLCGDIGFSVLEEFAKEFPDRFINVGVAEQNMIGIAAGLALSGKTVFTYTIGNFAFMRCLEQIRNDVCYHNLNVKIVAVGGGFAYGTAGYTHHTIEDIAMLRVLPNMTVVAPGDPVEARLATEALCHTPGPGYLRLGKGGEPVIHTATPTFALGRAMTMHTGRDATIISSAGTLDIAHQAVNALTQEGHSIGLISMPTLAPFDHEALRSAASGTSCFVTIEEHGKGGLASLVSECITSAGIQIKLRTLYVEKLPSAQVGDRNWLRKLHGIDAEALMAIIRGEL
jgi:transketolase